MATPLETAAAQYTEARQLFNAAVVAHKEAVAHLGNLQGDMRTAGEQLRAAESRLLESAAPQD